MAGRTHKVLLSSATAILVLAMCPTVVSGAPPGEADALPVRRNPATGHARMVFKSGGFLTEESAMPPAQVVRGYVERHHAAFGLSAGQARQLGVASSYRTAHNGAYQVTLEQR